MFSGRGTVGRAAPKACYLNLLSVCVSFPLQIKTFLVRFTVVWQIAPRNFNSRCADRADFDGVSLNMFRTSATVTSLLFLLLLAPASIEANVEPIECQDGDVLSGSYENVLVYGASCTLDGATVYGSVLMEGGSLATTANGASILGGIQVKSGGDVTLVSADVMDEVKLDQSGNLSVGAGSSLAGVQVKESGNVTIAASASAGALLVENSGRVDVRGSVAAILSNLSGGIRLDGARVFPGGVTMSFSDGSLEICGSEIGANSATGTDGSGVVKVIESGDVLVVAEGSCETTRIEGSVLVEKGAGNVRFVGATLHSDLIVKEQVGEVELDGSGCDPLDPLCGIVGDVNVEGLTGNVTLRGISTDSDATFQYNDGNVTIDSTSFGSDARFQFNGRVELTNSSFSLEDVFILGNAGPVLIDRNCDMRPSISENSNVMITNNNITDATAGGATCTSGFGFSDADVSKNTGGVLIDNNSGEGLHCSDNDPSPVEGSAGNAVTFSDGQCAGF